MDEGSAATWRLRCTVGRRFFETKFESKFLNLYRNCDREMKEGFTRFHCISVFITKGSHPQPPTGRQLPGKSSAR